MTLHCRMEVHLDSPGDAAVLYSCMHGCMRVYGAAVEGGGGEQRPGPRMSWTSVIAC